MKSRLTFELTFDSIPVSDYGSNETPNYVRLSDIKVVRPMKDGTLDVVYAFDRQLPSGITAHEIKSGYSNIDQLLCALGWYGGFPSNHRFAELTELQRIGLL